jgi:hypothetical protein
MKISSQTDLNFYKTERQSNNKAYKLKSLYENTENIILNNLTRKSIKEDILIPTEVETYLNVKKQYIFYINI